MPAKLLVSATILMAVLAAGVYIAGGVRQTPTAPDIAGLLWPDPPVIGPLALVGSGGEPFTEQDLQGRWTLIFFGYTHCPDVCPTTMTTLNRVYGRLRDDPDLFAMLQVLFVSVDPARDGNASLRAYMDYFNDAFIGATADEENLRQLTRQFGVHYLKVATPGEAGYTLEHSASIMLVDPSARLVGIFSQPHVAGEIADRLSRMVAFLDAAAR
jgi:protein SCO1